MPNPKGEASMFIVVAVFWYLGNMAYNYIDAMVPGGIGLNADWQIQLAILGVTIGLIALINMVSPSWGGLLGPCATVAKLAGGDCSGI